VKVKTTIFANVVDVFYYFFNAKNKEILLKQVLNIEYYVVTGVDENF
jgi:hypothetical protein